MAKLATLQDNCTTKNTTIWAYGTGCSQSANQMHVAAGNTSGSPNYDSNVSNSAYDLTGSYIFCKVTIAAGGTGPYTNLTLRSTSSGNGTDLTMAVTNGNLTCNNRTGYYDANATSIAYSATTMAWWQIIESGGTVKFQTSPDGLNWTTQRSIPTPSYATSVWAAPSANNTSGTSTDSLWSNFNVNVTANAKIATLTDPWTSLNTTLWTQQDTPAISYASAVKIIAAVSGQTTTFTAVGTITSTDTTSLSTNPAAVGNLYLVGVVAQSSTVWCTSISGGNCTWQQIGTTFTGTHNAYVYTMFLGTATATGSATATLNFNGTTPVIRCAGQQFSTTGGWALDGVQGNLDDASGALTANFPALTPSVRAGINDLYWSYIWCNAALTNGSTANFTYQQDIHQNGMVYNTSCGSVAQTPAEGNAALAFGAAILLSPNAYPNIMAVSPYDLTASAIFAKLVPPTGGTGVTTEMVLNSSVPGTDLRWTYNMDAGTISASSNIGYFDANAVTLTYNSAQHVFFKISEAGGTISWSTSPDAVNWTVQRQLNTVNFATAVTPVFSAEATTTASTTPATWSSLNTVPPVSIINVVNPGPQVFNMFSLQIQATDTTAGQTLTYTATGLPPGVTINSSTGLISGDPVIPGTFNVTVTVSDAAGTSSSVTFPLTVNSAPVPVNVIRVTNPGPQSTATGTVVSLHISATDSASGQTLSFTATGLPAGLSINAATGMITGTPTTVGNNTVTVTVSDLTGASGATSFSWTVNQSGPTDIVTVVNPGAQSTTVNVAVALHITATDSATGQTLTYSAAGLPTGLSINTSTGQITGTPTATGTSTVTVTAVDTTGASGATTFTWTINSSGPANTITVTNPGSQTAIQGQSINNLQIVATDSASGQTLTYTATGLPTGLTINSSTGVISGTPSAAGTFSSVNVTVKDTTNASGAVTFTWTVNTPHSITVTNPGTQRFTTGQVVSLQIVATET